MKPRSPLKTAIESLVFAAALVMIYFILRITGVIETETGNARVIDGDSLEIGGKDIRLHGIDAPEFKQPCFAGGEEWPCGREARDVLRSLVRHAETTCRTLDTDRYGRLVADCTAAGKSVNEEMVRRGFAIAYIRHSRKHARAEAEARAARRGIWRGTFETPQDWRDRQAVRRGDVASPPDGAD